MELLFNRCFFLHFIFNKMHNHKSTNRRIDITRTYECSILGSVRLYIWLICASMRTHFQIGFPIAVEGAFEWLRLNSSEIFCGEMPKWSWRGRCSYATHPTHMAHAYRLTDTHTDIPNTTHVRASERAPPPSNTPHRTFTQHGAIIEMYF